MKELKSMLEGVTGDGFGEDRAGVDGEVADGMA
jgi:hypothetical protein